MKSASIDDVADYVIVKLCEAQGGVNILKLHKLLYYIQAWHLALHGIPLFAGKFQAWIHGPVSRKIYDRFAETHMMYASLSEADVRPCFNFDSLLRDERRHIDEVLEAYASFSGTQLESMTHDESPWIEARGNRRPSERCENEISEEEMKRYFRREMNSDQ